MARDGEHNRIIKDLQKTVAELNHSYREQNLPVTDGSRELHSLCAQLEFLLQFDLKEKRSFFGQRKDYWDFLCQGLSRRRQEHEGVLFVTSLDKLKTPVGRGRAFLRYCLVHQQLAESLQLCLLDPENLCEWYYARSPFLNPQRRAEILGTLYELDGVTFHLALYRADLDTAWPMFSETLVRPSLAGGSCPAKTVPQTHNASTGAHGWTDGIDHPTTAPHRVLSHLYPPASAALRVRGVEVEHMEGVVEDMEMKKDMEDEERKEVEEVEDVEENVEVEKDVEQEDEEDLEQAKKEMEDVEVEKDVEQKDKEDLEQDKKEMEDVDVEENVKVEKDVEQEDEEDLEQAKKEMEDVEVLKDAPSTGKTTQPNGDEEPSMSLPHGMGCVLGSSPLVPGQLGRTEASVWALVSRLQAELEQQEAASRALAAQLAREEQRHRQREENSAQWAQLRAHEAEALRETNAFLERVLTKVVAAGSPGMLVRAREEAQSWREVAEERGARLAEVLAEAAALASRLQDCQAALAAAEQTDMLEGASAPNEVAAVEEVLRRALELARCPQEALLDPEAEGELSTATGMAMHLATLATTAREEARQSRQQLQALQQEVSRLQEQLSSARQDGERWASALQRAQREALEREATRGAEQARQQELIRDMKGRLLELLREKDALWQKTEGIDTPMPSPVPHDAGLCARCRKDFRLLSRRYNCRLCQGKVCHTCSVDVGKQGRCCLLCYQKRHPQAT